MICTMYMPPKVVPEGKVYLERDDEMPLSLWGEPFGIGMDKDLEREKNTRAIDSSAMGLRLG